VFGTDYDTPDGTCIRDYIHVEDLCEAHILAMESQRQGQRYSNLGIGHGYSVKDVIESAERVTGKPIPIKYGDRRAGDPPMLYANADKIRTELGWEPKLADLDTAVESAWRWMQANPTGYTKLPTEVPINA
jgi:UDP-glucose 4-epimerase